jgi:uncharacterized protein with HEPN domain
MPPDRDDDLLTDIVAAARAARAFTEGMAYADFVADLKTQSAVTFQLVVIGEAAKGLSEAALTRYPEVPWSKICRARDLFVHHYKKIDSEELWTTVSRSLSDLLQALENRGAER